MKQAIFVILIVFGAAICQAGNPVETCIKNLQICAPLVGELNSAFRSKNFLLISKAVTTIQPQIVLTNDSCRAVTKADIAGYGYSKLTDLQKECLSDVMGVIFSSSTLTQSLKDRKFNEFFAALKIITENAEITQEVCLRASN